MKMHPQTSAESGDRNAGLRSWHLISALLIIAFLILHIGNHIAMFRGAAVHIAVMENLRPLYRNPVAETALIAACLFQAISGFTMVVRGWRDRRGFVPWVQAISGLILIFFLANHVGAVLWGRYGQGLDTNLWFASAGFHAGFGWFFWPYYFVAVSALFAHLACAIWWRLSGAAKTALPAIWTIIGVALALGFVVVMGASGPVPEQYLKSYR